MEFRFASRLDDFGEGIFTTLNDLKNKMIEEGKTVYNLSVGTPDFEPSKVAMEAVVQAAGKPENYKYALADLPELIEAVIRRFQKRYGVELKEQEVTSVYGSQEGITHIGLALCNPGDIVLVPNPGYPIFSIGPALAGAKVVEYPLLKEKEYLPDLESIPEDVKQRAKFMIVSYPANPVCATAPGSFYEELVAFAKKYNIFIVHDNAYSDIVYDGKQGISFLSIPGAKDVGVEFYSLSKSYNLTGCRISFLVGNEKMIQAMKTIRSQIDYGTFLPVQYGAIAALNEPDDAIIKQCEIYEERMKTLCGGLRSIGWEVPDSKGSMFVWLPLPEGHTNSAEFALELAKKSGVLCTPGSSFGSLGEGYVRMALVLPAEEIKEAVRAIAESGMIKNK